MKKFLLTMLLISTVVFIGAAGYAVPAENGQNQPGNIQKQESFDPIKAMENMKQRVAEKYKNGDITKEKADEITAKLDEKIKEIKQFNSMTPEQKKTKVMNGYKAHIEKRVSQGKITKEEGHKAISEFKAKVDKWDGNGYPDFLKKVVMKDGKHFRKIGAALDKAVKDGKITEQQKQEIIKNLKDKKAGNK